MRKTRLNFLLRTSPLPCYKAAMLFRLLFLACALLPVLSAHAQYEVALALDKTNYVAQEPMTATVTIINRSGADVILGGPKGRPWLNFNVKDSQDRSISPLQATSDEPIPFPAGERIARKVRLTDTHAMTDAGTYSVTVSAYHPPSGDYYISNRVRFVINDVKPYGKPLVFGVPEGYQDAGRKRQYVLMIYRDLDRTYLYFRLVDDTTGQKLVTYQLGPVSVVREPQITMDRSNHLHVLFLASPDTSVYAVIAPDGKLKTQEMYRDLEGSRPQLFLTRENNVVANGGKKYDPGQEQAEKAAAASRVRSVSERPPGL
jgi:hypothetical protein